MDTNRQARETGQLTLDITPHPDIEPDGFLIGTLAISGALHCPTDVQAGDVLTVSVSNADGEVIAAGQALGTYPKMKELRERGHVMGTERGNKAKISP